MTYDSDKEVKGLFKVYDRLFKEHDVKGSLLEIGVYKGGSLAYALDKGFTVVGIDIQTDGGLPKDAHLHIINQSDSEALRTLSEQYGGWDVVIDDGCHIAPFVETSFKALWPFTRKMYVIEDWEVVYMWPEHREGWLKLLNWLISEKESIGYTTMEMVVDYRPEHRKSYLCMVK